MGGSDLERPPVGTATPVAGVASGPSAGPTSGAPSAPPAVPATGDGDGLTAPRRVGVAPRRAPRFVADYVARLGPSGWVPLAVLVGLAGVQSFDLNAFGILAPDIRHTFHLSVATVDSIATLTGAVPVVFSVHLGYWGDRTNRVSLSVAAGLLWGVTAILTGLAPVLLVLIVARTVGGVGQLTTETVYPSHLADWYD
ncbi:MAG TPA: MFS transporter, partial [Acidimicrobiales bacterium]|nr:MFS transporter [Acidimicrobiales bacterium]